MVNQNINIVKQPELGKKVSELRKAKGLTQEELVEKCNLNVRTVQRIEAGEVTPRSYTIKALFEALDYNWDYNKEINNLPDKKTPPFLYLAIGSAVLYFFISMVEINFEQEFLEGDSSISAGAFALIKSGSYVFNILFLLGWIRVLEYFPNGILKIALWLMIGANVIWYSIDLIALFSDHLSLDDYYFIKVSSLGFLFALLGLGFINYKHKISFLGVITGILLMISGGLFFTVIGTILALIPWTLAEIVQIGLLIYLILKIGRGNSPDFYSSPT